MSDPRTRRPSSPGSPGRFEPALAGALVVLALAAALLGSSWWAPLLAGALAVLVVALVQPGLRRRVQERRARERRG